MKVIIAGGRKFNPTLNHFEWLKKVLTMINAEEVVSGMCSGADAFGECTAKSIGIKIKQFPANWATHGKAAGPFRNREMAEYADCCILFPGGKGTINMKEFATRNGLKIIEYKDK